MTSRELAERFVALLHANDWSQPPGLVLQEHAIEDVLGGVRLPGWQAPVQAAVGAFFLGFRLAVMLERRAKT